MYNKEKNYVVEVNDGIYLMKSRFLEGYHFTKEIKKAYKYDEQREAKTAAICCGGKVRTYTITYEVT